MKYTPLFCLVAVWTLGASAAVRFANPFTSGMVLQRERAVPIWGTADAGEAINVTFRGKSVSTTADADGKWRVRVETGAATSEGQRLTANGVTLDDVLVGEVWFASGQSNMECPIWGRDSRYRDGKGAMMIAMTREPQIRFVKMRRDWSPKPKTDAKIEWKKFEPASFANAFNEFTLSATAFYYARELHAALNIPIGIIDASWGGTNIDAWTPRSGYQGHPELQDVADYPVSGEWKPEMNRGVISCLFQQPTALWNAMLATWAGYSCRGFIWYQGCHNNPEADRYADKMHALYDGWSREFENPELKLYYVMLAPFYVSWFDLQLQQLKFAAEEPNAAITLIPDHGNTHDIHPNDKESVAQRLAAHALKRDYGFTEIEDESPTLADWSIDGGNVTLTFNHAKSLYVYNPDRSKKCGFVIETADGKEHPADIISNTVNRLVIAAPGVTGDVQRVTYLKNSPYFGALYSQAALPVAPFDIDRTELFLPELDTVEKPDFSGMKKLYGYTIPSAPQLSGNAPRYDYDASAEVGEVKRVGYLYELERKSGTVEWVYTEFDSPSPRAADLGVPSVAGGFVYQGVVSNLVVRSNVKGVSGTAREGVIEFFPENYSPDLKRGSTWGGQSGKYDFNDSRSNEGKAGYGSMQVHDPARGITLWAFNHFDGPADCGIGPNVRGEHPDWTFMGNARRYAARRLSVYVR